ncbi:MAG: hypothetical protein B7Z55_02265, partial [Planctomycetales bacterium 12-60-4]
MHGRQPLRRAGQRRSRGFTLIELLVVVGIILLLTVMTLVSVNFTLSADRIKGTARQVQSYLAGARDRAIYNRSPRGVRFLLDPNNTHLATGMIYIGAAEVFAEGVVTCDTQYARIDQNGDGDTFDGADVDLTGRTVVLVDTTLPWLTLFNRGFMGPGSRIQIPKDTGAWYRITSRPVNTTRGTMSGGEVHSAIQLDRPCRDLAGGTARVSYALELNSTVLPGEEPVLFPQGVVVDLDGSQVPPIWRPSTFTGTYTGQMDILFSSRGVVIGDAASLGQIHLLLADLGDAEKWQQITGRNASDSTLIPFVPANNP